MKAIIFASALTLLSGLIMAMPAVAQHVPPSHTAHATSVPVPTQRYTPDASLKDGMRRARVAVDDLSRHETGHLSEVMTADRTVQEAVNYMFANCKLASEPDAALHSILLPLLKAAQALKAHPSDTKPVAEMRAQLARYPQYFDDPGWQPAESVQPAAQD